MSESTVDNAQSHAVPRSGAIRSGWAADRARLRQDFDALMAMLQDAESDLAHAVRAPPRRSSRPAPPAAAEAAREAGLAVARWDDRLDQRRRDAERHAAALEEVQRRLSRALRRLGRAAEDLPETPAVGAGRNIPEIRASGGRGADPSAVADALVERGRLDQGILEVLAGARATLLQACEELACRNRRIQPAETDESGQRLRRDSLESALASLERDNRRVRSARIGDHDRGVEVDVWPP